MRIDALLNGDERVMGKLARAVIALAEENATLRECAANAADVLEARTDKPQRMVAAGFVRRQLDATTRDKSGRGK